MKFLCDEMLSGLGRWLRAAGYDTKILEAGTLDEKIKECAETENRLILTCDRRFPPSKRVIFLSGHSQEEWAKELKDKLKVNWLYRPFSRCLICNAMFTEPDLQTIEEQAPPNVSQFWYCPHCKKLYWEGSHTEHMIKQLSDWK